MFYSKLAHVQKRYGRKCLLRGDKMKIDKKDYESNKKAKLNVWEPNLEDEVCSFVNALYRHKRITNKNKTAKELLEKYVRKTEDGECNPTPFMRILLK
jgi:hypothetical protein